MNRYINFIRKWLFCSWKHFDYRCYWEVGGRGLEGPWHCSKCEPCSLDIDKLLKKEMTQAIINNQVAESKWSLVYNEWRVFTGNLVFFNGDAAPDYCYVHHDCKGEIILRTYPYSSLSSNWKCQFCSKEVPDEVKFVVRLLRL